MNPNIKKIIITGILGTVSIIAIVFIPAGTVNYWQGWAYVGTFIVTCTLYSLYVALHDPALMQRRMQVGPAQEKEAAQKVIATFLMVAFVALFILSPLDHRFGWSTVPGSVSIIGDVFVALSFYVFYLVSKVNTYAAANVQVEAGQKVIGTGMYGLVRHPMYLGALSLVVGTPLALGSWWTLLLLPVFLLILYFRITSEEHVLIRDLPGYIDYRKKVKFHLIPFIW